MNYKKNGDPFINYLSITPIHDSNGQITHFVGIQSDISDLVNHKKAELNAKHEAAQVSVVTCIACCFRISPWLKVRRRCSLACHRENTYHSTGMPCTPTCSSHSCSFDTHMLLSPTCHSQPTTQCGTFPVHAQTAQLLSMSAGHNAQVHSRLL